VPGRPTWPLRLADDEVVLRPLRLRDARAWRRLRADNAAWLAPWEATSPDPDTPLRGFASMVRQGHRSAREGTGLPLAIEVEGRLVGVVSLSGVVWGSMRGGSIGYWVDRAVAGRGIVPTAVALLTDHCFLELGLHRVEINIRPENTASLRVVAKLGFRDEGLRRSYLHIDGDWRDHRTFALTADEVPGGLLPRWHALRDG
jgi:ribosomal-protein-alanine N-acetyltransferase